MSKVQVMWLALALFVGACGSGGGAAAIDTEFLAVPQEPSYAGPSASFEFRGTGPVAGFEARVDGGDFFAVESPYEWPVVEEGEHRFEVCAVDVMGRRDTTPAMHTWNVGPAVRTVIVEAPSLRTTRDTATLRFESHVERAQFHARLDAVELGVVESPLLLDGLKPGPHAIELWAVTPSGFSEVKPVAWNWSIVAPDVEVTFPPPRSITSADRIAVCGIVRSEFGVVSVVVNGVPATTRDGFATWVAEVPVGLGETKLAIQCMDDEGAVLELDGPIVESRGPYLQSPSGAVHDAQEGRVLVFDAAKAAVFAVDIESGMRTLVADSWADANDGFAVFPLAFDAERRRLFALHGNGAISAVDVDTGKATLVVSSEAADIVTPRGMAYDAVADRLFVSDVSKCTIHEFNLTDGTYRIASSATQGRGVDIGLIGDIAWDANRKQILLADEAAHGLVAIDPTTGDRTAIDNVVLDPQRVTVDSERDEAIVIGGGTNQLVRWDLVEGGRTAIHTDSVIGAWWPTSPFAVDVAGRRAFLVNPVRNDVTEVDLEGARDDVVVSGDQIGDGVLLGGFARSGATDAAYDAVRDRTLLALRIERGILVDHAVLAVDRATGRRDVVSSTTTLQTRSNENIPPRGKGPAFSSLKEIVVDAPRNRILVLDEWGAAVLAIDPVTGDRSVVAREPDDTLERRRWLQLALDGNRVVVTAEGGRYLSIDLESGAITTLPATLVTAESHAARVVDMTFVNGDTRLYVADARTHELIAVDLQTGACEVLAELPRDLRAMDYDLKRHCLVLLQERGLRELDLKSKIMRTVAESTPTSEMPVSARALCLDPKRRCAQVITLGDRYDVRGLFTIELETGACVIASKD